MVVLSACVLSRGGGSSGGRILVSRQYVKMTRVRVEGLLVAFSRLLGPHQQLQSQHTYIETSSLRYVYQPLDDALYVVLMTNLSSNIIDDLFTLNMMSQAVSEVCCGWICEEQLRAHAFEVVNIMDELVRPSGYRSVGSLGPVHQAIRMESQEEKLHKMILANKIEETKRTMKEKARELDREKMEKMRMERAMQAGGHSNYRYQQQQYMNRTMGAMGSSSSSFMGDEGAYGDVGSVKPSIGVGGRRMTPPSRAKVTAGSSLKRGMQLSSRGKREDALMESLAAEDGIGMPTSTSASAATGTGAANVPAVHMQKPIEVSVSEAVSVHLHQDGSFDTMSIQGQLSIIVHNEPAAKSRVLVENNGRGGGVNFSFITHPKIDKALFNRVNADNVSVLSLKDPRGAYPMDTDLGLLKWRANVSGSSDSVPLVVTCWPSESSSETYMNVEYEAADNFELRRVKIVIPVPSRGSGDKRPPTINSFDSGDTSFDARASSIVWEIPLIDDSNRTGSMEAVVNFACPGSSFFPINVAFDSEQTICDINVQGVVYIDDDDDGADGPPVPFASQRLMNIEKYTIG